jgi:autotransporter-associated beta strand protein
MKKFTFDKRRMSKFIVSLAFLAAISNVTAATRTWSGTGGDNDWQTIGNWDTVPVANDVLIFSGNNQVSNTNSFLDGTQFNGLIFSADAGSFILTGNAIKLAGPITNVSANAQVINLGLTNTTGFTVYCETNVTLAGIVKGGATLTKSGAGRLILNNSEIALNRLVLDEGVIDLASDLIFGTLNGGGTTIGGKGGTIASSGGKILLNGGGNANGPDWFGGSTTPIIIEAPIVDGPSAYDSIDYYNTGDLILRGANTYTGLTGFYGTRVQIGVDSVGTVGALVSGPFGTGPLRFENGYMSADSSTPRTILNAVIFTGNIILGNTSLNGKLTFSSDINLGNAARTVTANSEVQFDGALTNGGFVKAGAADVTLAGVNTYAGGTTISSNRLLITGSILDTGAFTLNNPTSIYTVDTSLKVGALTLADGTIDGSGAVTGTSYTVSSGLISANLGGDATLTKTGTGQVTLSGANTYTATVVNAGILLHAKPSALYNGDTGSWTKEKVSVANGATLAFNVGGPGEFTVEQLSTLRSDLSTDINTNGFRAGAKIGFDTSNFPGGTFELTESIGDSTGLGAGALGIAKLGSNTMSLAVANTYTGETLVNGGLLLVNHANALTTGTTLTAGGTGILDLNGYTFTVANLGAGGLGGTITDNAAGTDTNTLTVTAFTTAGMSARLADGPTRVLALKVSNANSGPTFGNNANTFSGGLTLKYTSGTGTRLTVGVAPVNTGTAGAIVSSPFGRGPITIGEAATDKAQIYMTAANSTVLNDIIFNTSLGTDQQGAFRVDTTGFTLAGTLRGDLAPVNLSNYGNGTAFLTGQITGTNGLWLRRNGGRVETLSATLNNRTANPNDYQGNTTIDLYKTLVLGTDEQIPHGTGKGDVYLYGKLNLNGYAETINGLYGTGTVDGGGTTTLKVGENNASSYFLGVITNSSGALTVLKTGSGTMSLATPLRHSGPVVVENGTLLLPYRAPTASTPVAGMVRWFDASSPDYVLTNSVGSVTNWLDRSGNNSHAVNTSGIRLPTYTSNGLNSMGALLCAPTNTTTGYGQYLQFPRLTNIRTVFSVFKGASFLLTDGSNTYDFHRPNDTDPAAALWHTTYTSANIKNGSTYVNGALTNGTTYAMPTTMNNGFNLVEVLTTGNVIADSFNRDRNVPRSGYQLHAEVLIYDRVLTEAERLQNEGYLMGKWLTDPFIPTGSTLTVLSGGVLDLNGHSQEVAILNGNGTVSNGTLVVASAIDLTNEVAAAFAVSGNLTLKPGAALRIDKSASGSDQVAVDGKLTVQGANTVLLKTLSGALPPFRVTLFTFGSLEGAENLSSWTVALPPELQNYETRFHAENNQVYVNVFLSGTVIHLK